MKNRAARATSTGWNLRYGTGLGTAGIGLVALLLLVSPLASGSGASAASKAPYHGAATTWSYSGRLSCARESTIQPWAFNLTSGRGGWYGASSAKACGTGASSSYIESGVELSLPLVLNTSGLLAVKVHFLVSFKALGATSDSGSCRSTKTVYSWGHTWNGTCDVYAGVFNAPYASIYDLTTKSWASVNNPRSPFNVSAESYESVDWGCYTMAYGGGCWSANYTYMTPSAGWTFSLHSAKSTVSLPGYYTASDHYRLYIEGVTEVATDAWGWTSASASSALNFGSHGNGVTLSSITVS